MLTVNTIPLKQLSYIFTIISYEYKSYYVSAGRRFMLNIGGGTSGAPRTADGSAGSGYGRGSLPPVIGSGGITPGKICEIYHMFKIVHFRAN